MQGFQEDEDWNARGLCGVDPPRPSANRPFQTLVRVSLGGFDLNICMQCLWG